MLLALGNRLALLSQLRAPPLQSFRQLQELIPFQEGLEGCPFGAKTACDERRLGQKRNSLDRGDDSKRQRR